MSVVNTVTTTPVVQAAPTVLVDDESEGYLRPLTPAERQARRDFIELDTMFNRQMLESTRAFTYGGAVGAFAGLLISFKYKRPVMVESC